MEYKRLLKNILLLCVTFPLFSGTPNDFESMSLGIIRKIEQALTNELPENYYVVKTHISPIGQAVNNQMYMRDCIINEKVSNGVSRAIIFIYEKDGDFDNQFNNDIFGDVEISNDEITLKLALISSDDLLNLIPTVIRKLDFSDIKLYGI